jgi:hypothetical protein
MIRADRPLRSGDRVLEEDRVLLDPGGEFRMHVLQHRLPQAIRQAVRRQPTEVLPQQAIGIQRTRIIAEWRQLGGARIDGGWRQCGYRVVQSDSAAYQIRCDASF